MSLVAPYAGLRVAGGAVAGYGCPGMSALAEGLVTLEAAVAARPRRVHHARRVRPDRARARVRRRPDGHHGPARRAGLGARRGQALVGLGTLADVVVVWARDDDGDLGAFVVDYRDGRVPGYDATVITGKSSNRGIWQADIVLNGVRIPAGNRLAGSRRSPTPTGA